MTTTWSRVRVTGPLAPYAQRFAQELLAKGYSDLSVADQLRLMAHASRWMDRHGLGAVVLSDEQLRIYCDDRREQGCTARLSPGGWGCLQSILRQEGLPAQPPVETPVSACGKLLSRYETYLVNERGLVKPVVVRWVKAAELLVTEHPELAAGKSTIGAAEVSAFCSRELPRHGCSSARNLASALRSFLRFLHVNGIVDAPLAQAIPPIASRQGATLPRGLSPEIVEQLVASCDRQRRIGRRDYAVLLLLARLGLRAGEVARLCLDDIDWRAGEIVVHGKGRREDRLPLPSDVGSAVVDYLRRGRPKTDNRHVFLRAIAPVQALSPVRITGVVYAACDRVGIPKAGAHRLRHSLATKMLRSGASLGEIGQVLRHAAVTTTAIYAKVDVDQLAGLAQPWPGERP